MYDYPSFFRSRLKTGEARGKSLPTLTPDSLHPQQFVYFREDSIPRYEIPGNLSPTLEVIRYKCQGNRRE